MKAVVKETLCPLTATPDPSATRTDEVLLGMTVEVLEQTGDRYWWVEAPYRYRGFAPVSCLETDPRRVEAWEKLPKKIMLHKNFSEVKPQPRVQANAMGFLTRGALVAVLPEEPKDGWQSVLLPDGEQGWLRAGTLADIPFSPESLGEEELRRKLVDTAFLYRGTPYRWGGKTPLGIDCSGLVSMAYLLCGITIYRDAEAKEGFPLRRIPVFARKPGDLLFFPGHVAMYMGREQFIHSTLKSDGVAVHSLDPAHACYREDLAKSILYAGSWF